MILQKYFTEHVAIFFQTFCPIKLWNHHQFEDCLLKFVPFSDPVYHNLNVGNVETNVKTKTEFCAADTDILHLVLTMPW